MNSHGDSAEAVQKAIDRRAGLRQWDPDTVIGFLQGRDSRPLPSIWTVEQLAIFQHHPVPTWVLRFVPLNMGHEASHPANQELSLELANASIAACQPPSHQCTCSRSFDVPWLKVGSVHL